MFQPPRLPGFPHPAALARGPEAEAGTEAGAGSVPTVIMCSHLRLVFLGIVLTSRFEAPDAPGVPADPAARAAVASAATVARVQWQVLPVARCPLQLEAKSLPMPGPDPPLLLKASLWCWTHMAGQGTCTITSDIVSRSGCTWFFMCQAPGYWCTADQ